MRRFRARGFHVRSCTLWSSERRIFDPVQFLRGMIIAFGLVVRSKFFKGLLTYAHSVKTLGGCARFKAQEGACSSVG